MGGEVAGQDGQLLRARLAAALVRCRGRARHRSGVRVHRALLWCGLCGRCGMIHADQLAPARGAGLLGLPAAAHRQHPGAGAFLLGVHRVGGLLDDIPHVLEATAADYQPLDLGNDARKPEILCMPRRPGFAQLDGVPLCLGARLPTPFRDWRQNPELVVAADVAAGAPHGRVVLLQLRGLAHREHGIPRIVEAHRGVPAGLREVRDGPRLLVHRLVPAAHAHGVVRRDGHGAGLKQRPAAIPAHPHAVGAARLGVGIARPVANGHLPPDAGRHVGEHPAGVRMVARNHVGPEDAVGAQLRGGAQPDLVPEVMVQQERDAVADVLQIGATGAMVQHLEVHVPGGPIHPLDRRFARNRQADRRRGCRCRLLQVPVLPLGFAVAVLHVALEVHRDGHLAGVKPHRVAPGERLERVLLALGHLRPPWFAGSGCARIGTGPPLGPAVPRQVTGCRSPAPPPRRRSPSFGAGLVAG